MYEMTYPATLWYFADPMCSWCWGFTANIERLRSSFADRLNIALMLGGLRPGTSEPVTEKFRQEIFDHWRHVHELTGQSFSFDGAMPDGFVYDTEPASRAVVTVADLKQDATFPYFSSIQSAFYVDQVDVTRPDNLAVLADKQGIDKTQFQEHFDNQAIREKTRQHFLATRQAGVAGFPSLVIQKETDYVFVARGYRPVDEIENEIQVWLDQHPE